jgi:glycerol-3-phosphate acyltransferase PlsX
MVMGELKSLFKASPMSMMSAVMVKSKLKDIKRRYDPTEYGGAPILGISKPVIKAHGSSNAKAFKSAIRQAIACVDAGITYDIAKDAEYFRTVRQAENQAKE